MTLMPFAVFGVAWLKVSFSVPLLAPFNVLSLRNHNAGGVFGVGQVYPQVRQDLIYTVPAIIIPFSGGPYSAKNSQKFFWPIAILSEKFSNSSGSFPRDPRKYWGAGA